MVELASYYTLLGEKNCTEAQVLELFKTRSGCGNCAIGPADGEFPQLMELMLCKRDLRCENVVSNDEVLALDMCLALVFHRKKITRFKKNLNLGSSKVRSSLRSLYEAIERISPGASIHKGLFYALYDLMDLISCNNRMQTQMYQSVSIRKCLSGFPVSISSQVPEYILGDRGKLKRVLNLLGDMANSDSRVTVSSESVRGDLDWRKITVEFHVGNLLDGILESPDFAIARGIAGCFMGKIEERGGSILFSFKAPRIDVVSKSSLCILLLVHQRRAHAMKVKIERICREMGVSVMEMRAFTSVSDAKRHFKNRECVYNLVIVEDSFRKAFSYISAGDITVSLGSTRFGPCSSCMQYPLLDSEMENLIEQATQA